MYNYIYLRIIYKFIIILHNFSLGLLAELYLKNIPEDLLPVLILLF